MSRSQQYRSRDQDPGSRYDLIDQVTLASTGLTLHVNLASLIPRVPVLVHEVPISIARRGIEMRLVHTKHDAKPAAVDPTLVRAVARGHRWFREMLTGGIGPEELAKTKGVSARYITRLVRLAFLSPAIVRTIVEGYQPPWLDADTLANRITIPLAWADHLSVVMAARSV